MANGNITIKGKTTGTTIGSMAVTGSGELSFLEVLYQYANLTLPYNPNDPGLVYTYDYPTVTGVGNPCSGLVTTLAPVPILYASFFNLLNEPSTVVPVNISAGLATSQLYGVGVECLDVRLFGAVGDGVTNDTAACQAALDMAWANYLAIQSALGQGQSIPATVGPTTVCVPAGVICAVGKAFWRTTCGTGWPNNPSTGSPWDNALYVRSGVTLQVDGEILVIPDTGDPVNPRTGGVAFFDNSISDGHVTNASLTGTGTIDGQSQLYPPFSTTGWGVGVYAVVSQGCGFSINATLTVQNFFGVGVLIVDAVAPNSEYPQLVSGVFVATLAVPTSTTIPSATVSGITIVGCGSGGQTNEWNNGGIFVSGYGITLSNLTISNIPARFGIYVAGADILVQGCTINNLGGSISVGVYVDCSLRCKITNNTIIGTGGTFSAGIQTRPSVVEQPTQLIDWVDSVQIFGNNISGFNIDIQFQTTGVLQAQTVWYRFQVSNNTLLSWGDVGLSWDSFSGPIWVDCLVANNLLSFTTGQGKMRFGNNGVDPVPMPSIPGLNMIEPQSYTQTLIGGVARNFGSVSETPAGTINGSNKTFTITNAPVPTSSLIVWVDGLQTSYTLSGGNKTITVATAPTTTILAIYNF